MTTNADVVAAFVRGAINPPHTTNLRIRNATLVSYALPIAFRHHHAGAALIVGTTESPSLTTTQHLSLLTRAIAAYNCDHPQSLIRYMALPYIHVPASPGNIEYLAGYARNHLDSALAAPLPGKIIRATQRLSHALATLADITFLIKEFDPRWPTPPSSPLARQLAYLYAVLGHDGAPPAASTPDSPLPAALAQLERLRAIAALEE